MRTGAARNLKEINTSNYCLAYLDILGSRKIMSDDDNDIFLNEYNQIYFDAVLDTQARNYFNKDDYFVKIFSDNILIAIEIKKGDESRVKKIEGLINLAGNIWANALGQGHLIRGAITEGSFFKDDIFVYGKALIDAVDIEENVAFYPRIIVPKEIQAILPQYFVQDQDGLYFLNCNIFNSSYGAAIQRHKLLEMQKKYKNDEKIMQKIMWAINYHNFCCNQEHITGIDGKSYLIKEEDI